MDPDESASNQAANRPPADERAEGEGTENRPSQLDQIRAAIRHITGVEIDPTIYDLGRRLNPDHVYQKPGVHMVIGDGRAFLERTQGTYDLIVFALPDSLALTSSFANLRLESYLFTREAFAAARRHLSPHVWGDRRWARGRAWRLESCWWW